jgi:hypothetical protein
MPGPTGLSVVSAMRAHMQSHMAVGTGVVAEEARRDITDHKPNGGRGSSDGQARDDNIPRSITAAAPRCSDASATPRHTIHPAANKQSTSALSQGARHAAKAR